MKDNFVFGVFSAQNQLVYIYFMYNGVWKIVSDDLRCKKMLKKENGNLENKYT